MRSEEKRAPSMRKGLLLLSVGYIAMGLVFLIFPNLELVDICYALGMVLMVIGAVQVAWYLIRKMYLQPENFGFATGLAQVLLGLFAVLKAADFAFGFAQVLAICMIADSIVKAQFAMDLLRFGSRRWYLSLLAGALTAALAMVVLINPFPEDVIRYRYTYGVLIADGVINLVCMLLLSRADKRYRANTPYDDKT